MSKRLFFAPQGSTTTVLAGYVEIERELGADQVDREVGRMFEVRYLDHVGTAHAFADELMVVD